MSVCLPVGRSGLRRRRRGAVSRGVGALQGGALRRGGSVVSLRGGQSSGVASSSMRRRFVAGVVTVGVACVAVSSPVWARLAGCGVSAFVVLPVGWQSCVLQGVNNGVRCGGWAAAGWRG